MGCWVLGAGFENRSPLTACCPPEGSWKPALRCSHLNHTAMFERMQEKSNAYLTHLHV
jgi:hypothetical protein